MIINKETTKARPALILIDIQKGLDEHEYYGGHRNNPDAEQNMNKLLDHWRRHHLPLFHVKHNSVNPQSPLAKGKIGNEIKDIVQPITGETVIEKNVNSAFIGTDLQQQLENDGITDVVIVGLTTEHCISSSVRMASNLGFKTYLISDATAAFDKIGQHGVKYSADMVHDICLANLNHEFAEVLTTEELISWVLAKEI